MRSYSLRLPAGVTDATDPNNAAFPIGDRSIELPPTLDSSDQVPRALLGALRGAAAATVEVWAFSDLRTASSAWVRLGTLTIAAESVAVPVVPGTAGAPTAFPGRLAVRITAAAATDATLHLMPS